MIDKHREGILYIVCGIGTCLISWGAYAIFANMGIDLAISNALSWFSGLMFAFITNKWIVFNSRSKRLYVVLKELSFFITARIFTGVLSIILFPILLWAGLDQSLLGIDGMVARITVTAVEIVLNYIASKKIVFTKKE